MESSHTIETILTDLLSASGIPHHGISREELAGQVLFSVAMAPDAHPLLTHTDTVHALDYLVKKIIEGRMNAESERHEMFVIDVNGQRADQIRELQTKALTMAEQARSLAYDVELSPMSSYERLIIHTTLQGAPGVKTESLGEGSNRRVVIKYSDVT
jgi:predicted RNA-binding protein Jag